MKQLARIVTLVLASFAMLTSTPARAQYQAPYLAGGTYQTYSGAGNLWENYGTPVSSTTIYEFRKVCVDLWEIPIMLVPALPPAFMFGVYSNERWAKDVGSLPRWGLNERYSGNLGPNQGANNGYVVRFRFAQPYQLHPNYPSKYYIGAFSWWDNAASAYRDTPFYTPLGVTYVDWFVSWSTSGGPVAYIIGSGTYEYHPTVLYSSTGSGFTLDSAFGAIYSAPISQNPSGNCSCNGVSLAAEMTMDPLFQYGGTLNSWGPPSAAHWAAVSARANGL